MFSHHQAEEVRKWLDGWKFDPIVVTPIFVFFLFVVAVVSDPEAISGTLVAITLLSPIWLPWFLFVTFWKTWMHYIRFQFWFRIDFILLEITLPPEVEKSPQAMELVLTSMWNSVGETSFIQRIWKGQFRPLWSLEIASNEGRIGFYIRTDRQWRNTIETRIYGQYPEARVIEVPDYTRAFNFNLDEYVLAGTEYTKVATHSQATPIRTYIDYALDKDTDTPETKIDPMSHLLELFGSIGKDQYLWLQIIMKARKKDEWYGFYTKHDSWMEPAKAEIEKIMAGAAKRAQSVLKQSDVVEGKMNALLTDAEKKHIEAIERSMSKLVFECGIRALHVAKKEQFRGPNTAGIVRLFDAYRSADLNALNIAPRGLFNFDYPWQDWGQIRAKILRKKFWFFYQNRAYFYVPYDQVPVLLTVEELASLWHFPSSAIKTPGLVRVQSKRAEAPPNLPTLPS